MKLALTTRQIEDIWKRATEERETWRDDLLDQWNENWTQSRSDNVELLHMARRYGVCTSSVSARLQGKAMGSIQIYARIEAWFKFDEVNTSVDQLSVETFIEMLGEGIAKETAISMVPIEAQRAIENRKDQWQALIGRHIDVDGLMNSTPREERRILREKSRAIFNEMTDLHNALGGAISKVYEGADAHLIEEPMRAFEKKIADSDGQMEKSWQETMGRAREELDKAARMQECRSVEMEAMADFERRSVSSKPDAWIQSEASAMRRTQEEKLSRRNTEEEAMARKETEKNAKEKLKEDAKKAETIV